MKVSLRKTRPPRGGRREERTHGGGKRREGREERPRDRKKPDRGDSVRARNALKIYMAYRKVRPGRASLAQRVTANVYSGRRLKSGHSRRPPFAPALRFPRRVARTGCTRCIHFVRYYDPIGPPIGPPRRSNCRPEADTSS